MKSNDENIELLDIPSTSSTDVDSASDGVSQVNSTEVGKGVEQSVSGGESNREVEESPSLVSPWVVKPSISGTTSNSPRISPEDTMAKTVHSASQTPPLKSIRKEEPSEVVSSHESNPGTTTSSKPIKPIVLIVTFVILLVAIIFLPMSGDLFEQLFSKKEDSSLDVTNGSLICTLEHDDNGDGISLQYTETYAFKDSKVESLNHEVLMQGNADYLTERNRQCELLQLEAADIPSVQIDCDLSSNQMVETQYFNLNNLDLSLLDIGFTEAGGVYPNGMSGENYKDVQRSLEMSGYKCETE